MKQNIAIKARVKTQICDAKTGAVIKDNPFRENLVMDLGLNSMAHQNNSLGVATPVDVFTNMIVGSGNSPNSVASGAVTFTQLGTALTSSGGFFTSGMVGCIFKYGTGTGGAEYYITAFTSSTLVTVDTSATVSTPTVATVWMVQKTALDNVLYASNSYSTNAGDCLTTFANAVVTHQRVFIIGQKGSPYTVNEIGYNTQALNTTTNVVAGRFVLSSSDVVGNTNFYKVTIQLVITYSPGSPTSVANVGTNIDTTGVAMIEDLGQIHVINPANGQSAPNVGNAGFDGGNPNNMYFVTAAYSQNSVPASSGSSMNLTAFLAGSVSWAYAGSRGAMLLTFAYTASTTGQTMYGVYFVSGTGAGHAAFDIKFTTPVTAPTGTFAGTAVFTFTYGRTLTN